MSLDFENIIFDKWSKRFFEVILDFETLKFDTMVLKVSMITHTYNVTTEENITQLEEEITYDVTELRMDPDYIRSVN